MKEPTIADAIRSATVELRAAGCERPRLDAELLLAAAAGRPRSWLLAHDDQPPPAGWRELVERRARREPVAYILGTQEFYGVELAVDPRVLIPRPDTETLVDVLLESELPAGVGLDLCTGSGCVAAALRAQRPGWRVISADISLPALSVARANLPSAPLVAGDGLAPFAGPFAWIAANPPYVSHGERPGLMPDVRDFEPGLALFAEADGRALLEALLAEAADRLSPGGLLLLECAPWQAAPLAASVAWGAADVVRDLAGRDRVIRVRKPRR